MTQFRPLLAYNATKSPITFPVLASPKIDGIRCLITKDGAVSRNLKPIPNRYIFWYLSHNPDLIGLDGELTVGESFNSSSSAIMTQDGEPDFKFNVFDCFNAHFLPFEKRLLEAFDTIDRSSLHRIIPVVHTSIRNSVSLQDYEVACVNKGYEGIMVRSPQGRYKFGRSTENEKLLGKIKRFEDREAVVIWMTPLYKNTNEPTIDALGLKRRSHENAGKVEMDLMGNLIVKDDLFTDPFEVGTGFTAFQRKHLYDNPPLGKKIKYKYLPHGTIDKPRHPVFLGFRDEGDLD